MKRKLRLFLIPLFMMFTILISSVSAEYLKKYTSYTYVDNNHPTIWRYDGTVSIRGADWISTNSTFTYPTYSKINYVVPGKKDQIKKIDSKGPDDSTRKGYITVQDSLNPIASKTKVYW